MLNTVSAQHELQNSPALCHKYKLRLCIFLLYLSSHVSLMKTENCMHIINVRKCYNISAMTWLEVKKPTCLSLTDHSE